jgi:tetratricopeptide (TPR) repeat protein
LLVRSGDEGYQISVTDDQIKSERLHYDNTLSKGVTSLTFYLRRSWNWKFWLVGRENLETQILLANRCRYAVMPVVVDGINVQKTWPATPEQGAWHQNLSRRYHLIERFYLDKSKAAFSLPRPTPEDYKIDAGGHHIKNSLEGTTQEGGAVCQIVGSKQPTDLESLPQRLPLASAYALPLTLHGPSSLGFIKHSVLLEHHSRELAVPGLTALLSAEGLKLDLTDFQVVRDETYEALMEQIGTHAEDLKIGVKERLYLFYPVGVDGCETVNVKSFQQKIESRLKSRFELIFKAPSSGIPEYRDALEELKKVFDGNLDSFISHLRSLVSSQVKGLVRSEQREEYRIILATAYRGLDRLDVAAIHYQKAILNLEGDEPVRRSLLIFAYKQLEDTYEAMGKPELAKLVIKKRRAKERLK